MTEKPRDTQSEVNGRMRQRIDEATAHRPAIVACERCLEDYELVFTPEGKMVKQHVCKKRKAL